MDSKENNATPSWFPPSTSVSSLNSKHIIQIPNFLSQQERNALFDTVCANQEAFQFIGLPNSNKSVSLHLHLGPEKPDDPKVMYIREACDVLSERIKNLFPNLFPTLGVKPFPVSQIPLSIMNGLNGHKGDPHMDESGGRFKISLLYYFNKVPKVFQGGVLEFYETDANFQRGHRDKASIKIEHEDNLLIAFASDTYHGVSPVQLDSAEFEDGRFVVVGFL